MERRQGQDEALRVRDRVLPGRRLGYEVGVVSSAEFAEFKHKRARIARWVELLSSTTVSKGSSLRCAVESRVDFKPGEKISAAALLRKPEIHIKDIVGPLAEFLRGVHQPAVSVSEQEVMVAAIQVKYEGYLNQQAREIERLRRSALCPIPGDFRYDSIPGLSREMVEKLSMVRPQTLDQAGRIPGVTPAAVQLVAVYLEMAKRKKSGGPDVVKTPRHTQPTI
ncbi:MAG: hypothetical protein B7X11_06095 [Acidobacteria bacterium 37-65-4]|nr:MAG: hypothetical protein B7X11_06095 [Acidobacteria bacterium 37-65-4]